METKTSTEEAPPPCSHGSYGFVNGIINNINTLPQGGVLINIQTLLRNLYSDDSTLNANVYIEQLKKEIQVVASLLAPTLHKQNEVIKPCIIFYLFDYFKIFLGKSLRSIDDSKERRMLSELTAKLIGPGRTFLPNGKVATVEGIDLYGFGEYVRKEWPDKVLMEWIAKIGPNRQFIMVSHQPSDWHLTNYLTKMVLVDSYTGNQYTRQEFSRKAFGDRCAELPFSKAVQQLVGDKPTFHPVLGPKAKEELLERSKRDNWKHHSLQYVNDAIKSAYGLSV